MTVVGLDPSLSNWGIARGWLDPVRQSLSIQELQVLQPVQLTGKQVRQNSKDLHRAEQLAKGLYAAVQGAQAIFVEVPVGSQSARAMASYGVCVGLLGALRAQGIPFFEVTPTEVKLAGAGTKLASKREMIQWAYDSHSSANWPFQTQKGKTTIIESKAEHMADAIAAIYAGLQIPAFQQALSFYSAA